MPTNIDSMNKSWVAEIKNRGAKHGIICWSKNIDRLMDIIECIDKAENAPFDVSVRNIEDEKIPDILYANEHNGMGIDNCADPAPELPEEEYRVMYETVRAELEAAVDAFNISDLYDLGGEE